MDEPKVTRPTSLRLNKTLVRRVDDSRLPPVRSFFERELGCQLSRPDRHGEAYGNCCFHQSKSGKSFAVNLETDLWYCHGCGFGGDMYSFAQRRYGLSYLDAAKYLGTLEDGAAPVAVPTELVSYLTLEYDIDSEHYCESVKDEPRDYADMIRRFYLEASDRLTELRRGDAERYTGEEENCWAQMVCAVDEWRGNL